MEIPTYWAQHRIKTRGPKRRPAVIARYGWSDESEDAARRHAEQRATEAVADLQKGRKPTRRELKSAYLGGDGLPIREEVVSRHEEGGAVVTRNRYGARCLNVPDTLFGDIDLDPPGAAWSSFKARIAWSFLAGTLALWIAWGPFRPVKIIPLVILGILILIAGRAASRGLRRLIRARRPPERALDPVRAWCESHPDWFIAVYRTPAGYRLIATHGPVDPRGGEADAFFEATGCDPIYHRMSRAQACYRARVSAKPWRAGVASRIGYRWWPITEAAALEARAAWVKAYEAKAAGFAACRRIDTIGTGVEDAGCRAVRELHDRLSRAESSLPLA